jgi:hypothetical protein
MMLGAAGKLEVVTYGNMAIWDGQFVPAQHST